MECYEKKCLSQEERKEQENPSLLVSMSYSKRKKPEKLKEETYV